MERRTARRSMRPWHASPCAVGASKGVYDPMNKLWQRIFKRRQSYRRLFLDGDGRVHPTAEVVLADLKRFCRADTSTVVVSPVSKAIDPLAMAMAEGRREV
jgi:hypothetical protein